MAQDLTLAKTNFATGCQQMADRLVALARDCDEFSAQYFAHAFDSTNVFVQGDLTGANSHLTPTIIVNVITQVQLMTSTFTASVRNTLRAALNTQGLP